MKDQWIWRESNKMTREEKDEKERWKKEEQVSVIHVEKKNNNKHTAWNICNWSPKRSRKRLGQKNNVWRNNAEMFQTLWKQKHRSKKLKESKAKKTIPRYIIVNLSKIKAKEKKNIQITPMMSVYSRARPNALQVEGCVFTVSWMPGVGPG